MASTSSKIMPLSRILLYLFILACSLYFTSIWCVKEQPSPLPRVYQNETIFWRTCSDLPDEYECGTINVPLNHFRQQSLDCDFKSFSVPLMRLRGKTGSQNLIINPGGPGYSGLLELRERGRDLQRIVGKGFHIVSFDPRGTGGSKPLASCYPENADPQIRNKPRAYDVSRDSGELHAWTQNYVRACRENTGDFGMHVNTPQTAADMNSILDALGQEKLIYWGFSYGTILGQTYATLYPDRVQRLIIDGIANVFDWYKSKLDFDSIVDAENVLDGFFDECSKAGSACSLSAHATSKEGLARKVNDLIAKLKEQPQSVYLNSSRYGLLTYANILYDGIYPALYRPSEWTMLAKHLSQLLHGNATAAFLQYGNSVDWISNPFVIMNDGFSGPTHWSEDRKGMVALLRPYVQRSIFGPALIADHYKKQQWLIPNAHGFVPEARVRTAHPMLILSTTFDPVCPLKSAIAAKQIFSASQIIELRGYGHCSYAMPSACAEGYVRRYLMHGELPQEHTVCEVDGLYFR